MQVKTFEARSMKEALEMVKHHLGPDAILLSAKELGNKFGIAGENSVQVTAAVSEQTLRKKQLAEAKMNQLARQKFQQIPARRQKEYIEKVFSKHRDEHMPKRPMTQVRYADIDDDGGEARETTSTASEEVAKDRIRYAARAALMASRDMVEELASPPKITTPAPEASEKEAKEILELRKEISHLRGLIERFQDIPQTFVSRHPGAEHGLPYELSSMFQKLTRAGISVENTVEILNEAQNSLAITQLKKSAIVSAWVAKRLLDSVNIAGDRTSDRFHVFMGSAGQGKTASLVKLASHMVICEKKKVAIVSADSFKVGASEQLRIFSQILNVPFCQIKSRHDWDIVLKSLRNMDHILVDFPGLRLRSINEVDGLRSLLPPEPASCRVHYVQSVLAKDQDAFEMAERYKAVGFQDVIFTCLDESVQHGLIYNFQKRFGVPLHSFGIGPQIPEDFEAATKERVIDLIFKLTKLRTERGR